MTDLRRRVQSQLDTELNHQRRVLAGLGDAMDPLLAPVASLLRGGKRLRAAFCYWGYVGSGGSNEAAAVRAAAAMEMFQAAALLHDDVMDNSDTRRGAPAAHVVLSGEHADHDWIGSSERFGIAGAILAGNLCLVWTDEMIATSGWDATELDRAREEFDAMRTQLMGGQFLDVLISARGWDELSTAERIESAGRVIRYKSAKYSIEQPLLIGARAAGASPADVEGLSRYGLALGEAFQLRDDLLGVYGDPGTTGKPAGDDIREGKRTVLLAYALDRADAADTALIEESLGDPDLSDERIRAVRAVVERSGGLARTEERIAALVGTAETELAGLQGLTPAGRVALGDLIGIATDRVA